MTARPTTVTPLATYRNETPYPFCPGCGHGPILDALNRALVKLGWNPGDVVIVSDIGCSGLSDQYFVTSVFHGLHGRSITYASGIKLVRPELHVIVIMGDGGAGIGGAHLLSAARRNIGLTVLVLNNLNFGMTGGQHSTTTPPGAITSTTPAGHLERPLDICATVAVNGAAYVMRGTRFDRDLPDRIAEAMTTEGFALLDIWAMCTAHFVPANQLDRKAFHRIMDRLGFARGVLEHREVEDYGKAYHRAHAGDPGESTIAPHPIQPAFPATLDRQRSVVIAGSAGGKVRSAARLVGRAGIFAGLQATQRDDYPITVKSGHSLSELVFSPEEIHYTGVHSPDALIVLTEDGRKRTAHFLDRMTAASTVFTVPAFADLETAARVVVVDPAGLRPRIRPADLALALLAVAVKRLGIIPPAALEASARESAPAFVGGSLKAIRAGLDLED